jgi:hypothetical protein
MSNKNKIRDEEGVKVRWEETSLTKARNCEPGIQISLRLPRATLAKLSRLAAEGVQSKSQYITKLLQGIPEIRKP